MNEIYINPETGELFEVSADKKDQFLIDFPNAVLQTEEEKPEEITTEMFVNPDNGEQFEVSIDKKDLFLQDFQTQFQLIKRESKHPQLRMRLRDKVQHPLWLQNWRMVHWHHPLM